MGLGWGLEEGKWSGRSLVEMARRTHHQLQARFGEYEPLVHQAIQQFGRVFHNGHVGDLGRVFFWRGEV